MKKNLIITSLVLLALVVLSSCIISIDPDPYDPEPKKDPFTFTSVFKGPVKDKDGNITSYQFMCYVNNNTGKTLEDVKFEIDWKDQLGNIIDYEIVTIPRLEKGAKWPVGAKKEYSLTRFLNSTASIRHLSSGSDYSNYAVNFYVYDRDIYHTAGEPTVVSANIKNKNTCDVVKLKIYVVSETSSGVIAEYGMEEVSSGILTPDFGDYKLRNMELNPPAKTPANGKTYFYVVGSRKY